ncbi:threonine dehydrogenase-like Zn-dependent dehydrogenase [Arthrobacter globiformis]|nr:threonine dehydrogenase-like Zn-dependent dehydrogenase [Arthrobacter globiformis]
MKAARFHGQRDIRIEDVPEPELRPGAVKIAVAWCGICGTDLHEFRGSSAWAAAGVDSAKKSSSTRAGSIPWAPFRWRKLR